MPPACPIGGHERRFRRTASEAIATYAELDREADLLTGERELPLAGVDRATIRTAKGGSAGASLVRGDRTASLHLYDAGLSVQEQQRTLEELASRVVEHWSSTGD